MLVPNAFLTEMHRRSNYLTKWRHKAICESGEEAYALSDERKY